MLDLGKNNINVKDAAAKTGGATFIDVRTPQEYDSGHISESTNIDFYDSAFTENVSSLDKTKEYIVYCERGGRGSKATRLMKNKGFERVHNLEGGITGWQKAGNNIE